MVITALISFGSLLITILPVLHLGKEQDKLAVAGMMAFAIGLWALFSGHIKRIEKSLFLFLLYIPFCIWQAPKPLHYFHDINVSCFYTWETVSYLLAFVLLYLGVNRRTVSPRTVLSTFVWIGVIVSCHVFLSSAGFTQWLFVNSYTNTAHTPGNNAGSFLQHPMYLGSLLCILAPLAVYLKRWWSLAAIIGATLLTKSHMGIGALIIGLLFAFGAVNKRRLITLGVLLVIGAVIIYPYARKETSGRISVWTAAMQDIKSDIHGLGPQGITGYGPGAFSFIHHEQHKSPWFRAHNEYLELMYDTGPVGLFLFLVFIYGLFSRAIFTTRENRYILAALFAACANAFGTVIWHLGPTMFITVVLAGLLDKECGKYSCF